ncbi:capsid portal protein [Vibrio phage J14]|nr:capsid portal protein [Vibrio phage J14]
MQRYPAKAEGKSKGVVVETESTTGSLDKEGKVDVKVERFSSEQTKDSLFGGYLDKCFIKRSKARIVYLNCSRVRPRITISRRLTRLFGSRGASIQTGT